MARVVKSGTRERLLVFTDLDGTLQDHETYSYAEASEALELLRLCQIPLILCSSKTRAEIEPLRAALKLRHPFICENGGALFIPTGYFTFRPEGARRLRNYEVVEFGADYAKLVETLRKISKQREIRVRGFSDMSPAELARDCGLSVREARLAKRREYDEPFRILDERPQSRPRLLGALRRRGLRCVRGGRYFHVTGATDKGLAVRTLKSLYEREWGAVRLMGLGDGLNDASLLREVDVPVIVRNPTAGFTGRLHRQVPAATLTRSAGPRGWNEAVIAAVAKYLPQ